MFHSLQLQEVSSLNFLLEVDQQELDNYLLKPKRKLHQSFLLIKLIVLREVEDQQEIQLMMKEQTHSIKF
jgi:hypothetical protein